MRSNSIKVPVKMDAGTFRGFAIFDMFFLRKRWRTLALFAGIFILSAAVCFAMRGRAEQAELLGFVLLVVGLGLPAVYVGNFLWAIRIEAKKLGLGLPRPAYTLKFDRNDGMEVSTPHRGSDNVMYLWGDMHAAYRVKGCVYLYVNPDRAYLLPEGQVAEGGDVLWELIASSVSPEKVKDFRRSRRSRSFALFCSKDQEG